MTETTTMTESATILYDKAREYEDIADQYQAQACAHLGRARLVYASKELATCIRRDEVINEANAAVGCICSAHPLYSQALCNWNALRHICAEDVDASFVELIDPQTELIKLGASKALLEDLEHDISALRRAAQDLC